MHEERRSEFRHRVRMPVRVDGGIGETRDISVGGLYFFTRDPVAENAPLTVTVSFEMKQAGALDVRYTGRVVRVEAHGDRNGVALAVQNIGFEPKQN